jgi:dTDP-4-amino-4,6-dideoxygalactose transaminase
MEKSIQVLKPFYRTDETLSEIRDCLEKGWTGIGFKTEEIEQQWINYSGFSFAHFLNSATSGLHLAFNLFKKYYEWNDGDEVITSALTFVSTNHSILYESLKPVFADVDDSLCLDPVSVENSITSKTRAIIFIGIAGNAANYKKIKQLCEKYNLIFILDAAHMAGTRWLDNNSHVGLDADCTIFSFQAVKNCPSADSGMICFKEKGMDHLARTFSWLGIDKTTYSRFSQSAYKWKYDVNHLGFKYHGNSIMAAMCIVSLKYLEADNAYRRNLVETYNSKLKDLNGIRIIHHSAEVLSSRHLYQILSDSRDDLIDRLADSKIFCGVHYVANTKYSLYSNFKNNAKNAEVLSDKLISLPLHLSLEESDVCHISEEIKKYC